MGSWFSKKPKKPASQVTTKDQAVLDLKRARDRLQRYQRKVEGEKDQWHDKAKTLILQKKKDRALLCLKMKKYKEAQLQKTDGQLMNLMTLIDTIDWETQQQEVLHGLKQGNDVLKAMQEQMTLEDAQRIMDDTADAVEYQQQLGKILGTELSSADASEVEAEFAELEALTAAEDGFELDSSLPAAPTTALPTPATAVGAGAGAGAAAATLTPAGRVAVPA